MTHTAILVNGIIKNKTCQGISSGDTFYPRIKGPRVQLTSILATT